jgi:helicase required for RNAi-mediated heterochromatin assembly 1
LKPSIVNLVIRKYVESSLTTQAIEGQEWLLKREVPSTEEVLGASFEGENEEPPHNDVDKPWTSKEAYLKAQYGILREDMLRPIRLAIKNFRESPEMNDDNDTRKSIISDLKPPANTA